MSLHIETPADAQRFYWGLSYASGYFHLGMLSEAEKELLSLGKYYRNRAEVLSLQGLILLARKCWHAVINQSLHANELYPKAPDFYIQAAYAYDKLNQPAKARSIWLSAPAEVQASPLYHYNIARCEARLGNLDLARQYIKRALTLAPDMLSTIYKDPNLKHLLASLTAS